MHPYRQLYLGFPGVARLDLPGHHDLLDDVRTSIRIGGFETLSPNVTHSAVYVQGRNAFNRNGQPAKLGVKAFAFMWTASVCLFLACLLYCIGGAVGRKDSGYSGREQRRRGFFSSARSNSVRSQKKETSSFA